jgi:hypothetical protein
MRRAHAHRVANAPSNLRRGRRYEYREWSRLDPEYDAPGPVRRSALDWQLVAGFVVLVSIVASD